MAFVKRKGESYVDSETVIHGRPDLCRPDFGITEIEKHPPYVFATRGVSCLVHKIAHVKAYWWRVATMNSLVRVNRPMMIAITTCGQSVRLEGACSRTCRIPAPDALLCGRCHGEPATFGKHGKGTKAGIRRQEAHVKLGCVVQGY